MGRTLDGITVVGWTAGLGLAGFAVGFFGPLATGLGGNQGPMAGIFVTGPLCAAVGLGIGLVRAQRARRRRRRSRGMSLAGTLIERDAA